MHTGKGAVNLLEAGFVYCFFLAPLLAFGRVPQRKLHSDYKWIISQLASRGHPGFGRMLCILNEMLHGEEPRQNEENTTHNKQLCKQVLLKQPYRSDATLSNIVTNPCLWAVSCLSPLCKMYRHSASCQQVGALCLHPCRLAGGSGLVVVGRNWALIPQHCLAEEGELQNKGINIHISI